MPANHCKPHSPETRAKMSASHAGKPRPWKHRPSRITAGVQEWRCGKCEQFFPREGFYPNKRTSLGLTSECKTCHQQTSRSSRNMDTARRRQIGYEATRRARIAGGGGTVSTAQWQSLLTILGAVCLRCGETSLIQRDHIIPLSKGGVNHPTNLQPLCKRCNEVKQARDWDFRSEAQKELAVVEFKRVEA